MPRDGSTRPSSSIFRRRASGSSGRDVVRAFEEGHGAGGSFELTRLTGEGDVRVAEGLMRSGEGVTYVVSISELRNGHVPRSIDYFAGPLPSMVSATPEDVSDE
jgi:hypothetical protein